MAGIDHKDLALRVQKGLDDVFPDEDESAKAAKDRREGLVYALRQLRSIAGGLQWRVPLKGIQAYAQELSIIQQMVADEKHLLLLVKFQSELCRYMLARRRRDAAGGLEKIVLPHFRGPSRGPAGDRPVGVRSAAGSYGGSGKKPLAADHDAGGDDPGKQLRRIRNCVNRRTVRRRPHPWS